jgi:hypothetical protein
MQLRNIQQQITKRVEVYYECLLKLVTIYRLEQHFFFHHCFQGMVITLSKISNYKYEDKYFNQTQKN